MLSGPFGVGKSTLANLLAMAMFCERDEKPCGQCAKCLQAEHRGHANLISLSPTDKGKPSKSNRPEPCWPSFHAIPSCRGLAW